MNQTLRTKSRHGYSIKFSPYFPHRLACATSQYYGIVGTGTLFVLDTESSGLRICQQFEWSDGLFDLTWAENNENILVTAGGDGSIQVWDVTQPNGPLKVLKEHDKEVNAVEWSQTRDEHFILSASWDKLIKLWDINSNQSINTFPGHEHLVYQVSWSPHIPASFASASGDRSVRLWDCRDTSGCSVRLAGHDGEGHRYAIRRIRTSPFVGSRLSSASYDFTVKFWDVDQGTVCIDTVEHHSEFVYGLDYNMHVPGQMADCGWDELIHVYHTSPSKLEHS